MRIYFILSVYLVLVKRARWIVTNTSCPLQMQHGQHKRPQTAPPTCFNSEWEGPAFWVRKESVSIQSLTLLLKAVNEGASLTPKVSLALLCSYWSTAGWIDTYQFVSPGYWAAVGSRYLSLVLYRERSGLAKWCNGLCCAKPASRLDLPRRAFHRLDLSNTEYELLAEVQAGEDGPRHLMCPLEQTQSWYNRREWDSLLKFVSTLHGASFGWCQSHGKVLICMLRERPPSTGDCHPRQDKL